MEQIGKSANQQQGDDGNKNDWEAAKCFGVPRLQVRYYDELSQEQCKEAARHWGKIPPYGDYVYAVGRDNELFSLRWRIVRLQQLSPYR